jgi:ribosomal protein S18 acetylase RimI-like enzyme
MSLLRAAEPADRALLRGLLADYLLELDGTVAPYPYFDAYWSEPERLPFLIEANSDVAGFCLVRVLDGGWHIAEFSVLPEKRRKGVGRAAVDEIARHARAHGARHLEANVYPHNAGAVAFWQAAGFEIVVRDDEKIVTRLTL